LKGVINKRTIKLKTMTNRVKIIETIKNIIRHTVEEVDAEAELKQQQLQQQHIQYEIQNNIKIISKTRTIKRKAILE